MEPRDPSFFSKSDPVEEDPEEPLEVPDYYEAIQDEWLNADVDENLDHSGNPLDPHRE